MLQFLIVNLLNWFIPGNTRTLYDIGGIVHGDWEVEEEDSKTYQINVDRDVASVDFRSLCRNFNKGR